MAYEWDIFLSYPRGGYAQSWVENHFHPALSGCLEGEMAHKPKIFVDTEMWGGETWPLAIQKALQKSRLLVTVWTPPYFQSHWCMSEWESMLAREKHIGQSGTHETPKLVYPVVFSDGKHFDKRASKTQSRDFSDFNYYPPSFQDSPKYLQFFDLIKSISKEIETRLTQAPDWRDDFPLLEIPPIIPDGPVIKLAKF